MDMLINALVGFFILCSFIVPSGRVAVQLRYHDFMKTFNFLKSHKFFVFGLIFSFCLCFIRPIPSSADDSLPGTFRFGYINNQGVRDYFEVDQPLNLFQLFSGGADQIYPSSYDGTLFRRITDTLNLTDYFYNWDPYNPIFFVNLYSYFNNYQSSDYQYFFLDFRKSSFIDFDYSSRLIGTDQVLVSNDPGFPSVYDSENLSYFPLLSLPTNFYLNVGVQSTSNPFYIDFYPRSYNSTFVSAGSSYPIKCSSVSNINIGSSLDYSFIVSDFLSNSDYYSLSIYLYITNSRILNFSYSYNCGFEGVTAAWDMPFASFSVYRFSSPESFSRSWATDYGTYSYYLPSDSDPLDIFDVVDPYVVGMSFTPSGGLIPTPTPIPSPEWLTPTPMPTVTPVPVTLTPIPQYINPDLDIDSTEVKTALSGYLDIIDDTFSNFAIFALGSQVLSYLYSFSSYFSFVLLIPAICLIAYAIGRLNQK